MIARFASVRTYWKRTPRSSRIRFKNKYRLCCKQLPIHGRCNCVELPHVIGPGEFNLKSASSAIVANAANLNILHRMTFALQRLDAVPAVAHPIPTAGAPMEVTIHVRCGHLPRPQRDDVAAFGRPRLRQRVVRVPGCCSSQNSPRAKPRLLLAIRSGRD
jgi:hypothetical protein